MPTHSDEHSTDPVSPPPVQAAQLSSAELYALLSALAQVPVKQSIAVTGSINQHAST